LISFLREKKHNNINKSITMLLYRFTRNESLFLGLKLAGFSTIHTISVLGVMVPTMTGSKIISAQVQEQLQVVSCGVPRL
jgi:hypothetical protein